MNEAMNESRAAAGAEHLQTAALEMISAVRAFLDVAEDVVSSNDRIDDLGRIVGSVAQGVSNATGINVPGARPGGPAPEPTPGAGGGRGADRGDGEASTPSDAAAASAGPDADLRQSGVQHIRVS